MKIFVFKFNNYYSGSRCFNILANSEKEALDILTTERGKYINDDETVYVGKEEIDLDTPRLISEFR